jgi:hypothetical protein
MYRITAPSLLMLPSSIHFSMCVQMMVEHGGTMELEEVSLVGKMEMRSSPSKALQTAEIMKRMVMSITWNALTLFIKIMEILERS